MRRAYETDNGPGGVSWEVQGDDGAHLASLPRDADLAPWAPVEVYTLVDWEQAALDAFGAETDPLDLPAVVIEP